MAGRYYRDEDLLIRELEPGSPQRWNGGWVDYPRFEWARAQELTVAQARTMEPEAFEYPSLPGLEHVYLEDSYVLDIDARGREVRFDLEAVVLPGHPAYQPPRADEQYCYLAGVLRFTGARDVDLRRSGRAPSVDPDGSPDYGNVDVFRVDGEWFELHGDWGSLRLRADPPEFTSTHCPSTCCRRPTHTRSTGCSQTCGPSDDYRPTSGRPGRRRRPSSSSSANCSASATGSPQTPRLYGVS